LKQIDWIRNIEIPQPIWSDRLREIIAAVSMRRISDGGGVEGAAARRKLQIMYAPGQILDNLKHGVLEIGVELALDRQVDGAATRQGVKVHGLTSGEFLSRLMQVETNEVTDLVSLDINDLDNLTPSDYKRSPFSSGNH
jgi:hypothetical protein